MFRFITIILVWACLTQPAHAGHAHTKHKQTQSSSRSSAQVSTWVYDVHNETTLQGSGVAVVRPMASLTKLMTAMVSLDHDSVMSHTLHGQSRERLFQALLIRSNNEVAEQLSRDYPGGRPAFLAAMNRKAQDIGMTDTHFDDPSGRISTNVSTAQDVGRMLMAAMKYPEIRRISTYQHLEQTHVVRKRHRSQVVHTVQNNTNVMVLQAFPDVIVSKTGFTNPAGYCVGVVIEQGSQHYVVVVMGARNRIERFDHVRELMHTRVMHSAGMPASWVAMNP